MLALTRNVGQSIKINDDITVTVVSVSGTGQVKLGFTAPRSVAIHREEIWDRIQSERFEAMENA